MEIGNYLASLGRCQTFYILRPKAPSILKGFYTEKGQNMRFRCCVQMITLLFLYYIIKGWVCILANDSTKDICKNPNVMD